MGDAGEWVGCVVKIKTNLGEEFEGEVFTFDKGSNIVVLKSAGEGGSTVRLLKANFITEIVAISAPVEGAADAKLPHVDYNRCTKRFDDALAKAVEDAERIGVDVTAEAQDLFDQFSKTMGCRWDGKAIVVLEEVRIAEPYRPENCNLMHAGGSSPALDRVKKVLELERARMQMSA